MDISKQSESPLTGALENVKDVTVDAVNAAQQAATMQAFEAEVALQEMTNANHDLGLVITMYEQVFVQKEQQARGQLPNPPTGRPCHLLYGVTGTFHTGYVERVLGSPSASTQILFVFDEDGTTVHCHSYCVIQRFLA
tara:strand:+ start:153 stop:566 length:414 start_codon:yes stop_codon:yes gene_type:complete